MELTIFTQADIHVISPKLSNALLTKIKFAGTADGDGECPFDEVLLAF